ncbi:UNVERIFIED_CONTAM: hypothetical protein FKN15_074654 [Acipenser sinensis]
MVTANQVDPYRTCTEVTDPLRFQPSTIPILDRCYQTSDCGDHVVVMNTRHIAFSGNKWEQKVYSSHTGYPGGFKQVTAAQLHQKDPTSVSVVFFLLS